MILAQYGYRIFNTYIIVFNLWYTMVHVSISHGVTTQVRIKLNKSYQKAL